MYSFPLVFLKENLSTLIKQAKTTKKRVFLRSLSQADTVLIAWENWTSAAGYFDNVASLKSRKLTLKLKVSFPILFPVMAKESRTPQSGPCTSARHSTSKE